MVCSCRVQNGLFAAWVYRCSGRDPAIGTSQRQLARACWEGLLPTHPPSTMAPVHFPFLPPSNTINAQSWRREERDLKRWEVWGFSEMSLMDGLCVAHSFCPIRLTIPLTLILGACLCLSLTVCHASGNEWLTSVVLFSSWRSTSFIKHSPCAKVWAEHLTHVPSNPKAALQIDVIHISHLMSPRLETWNVFPWQIDGGARKQTPIPTASSGTLYVFNL